MPPHQGSSSSLCSVAKSCPTLWDPMDFSPPGSSVHGILQARILEWVAIFSSRGSSWPRDWAPVSCTSRPVLYHWATWEAKDLPIITLFGCTWVLEAEIATIEMWRCSLICPGSQEVLGSKSACVWFQCVFLIHMPQCFSGTEFYLVSFLVFL